jgi:hypothetical protein
MQKQRIKTHVVDRWRSLCVRATLTGGRVANRPAQVFDAEIWNKSRQEASQSEGITTQAQDLTLVRATANMF